MKGSYQAASTIALGLALLLAGCGRGPLTTAQVRPAALVAQASSDDPDLSAVPQALVDRVHDEAVAGQHLIAQPLAFKTDAELDAYLRSLAVGLQTKDFDREGFLASLGIPDGFVSGRTDAATFKVVQAIKDYKPGTLVDGKPISSQVMALDVALANPRLFLHLITISNATVEAPSQSRALWKAPFEPREDLSYKPENAQDHYSQAFAKYHGRSYGLLFDEDMHSGLPTQANMAATVYGTYHIAMEQGFLPDQAARIAKFCNGVDEDITPYGKTSFTPSGSMDRHFNLDRGAQDTRLVWAKRHLQAAVALAHQHSYDQAEIELGCGLHSLQDVFAHGQLTPSMHGVIGEFPDQVTYDPVGVYEATRATVAYFNAYLKGLGGVSALYTGPITPDNASKVSAF